MTDDTVTILKTSALGPTTVSDAQLASAIRRLVPRTGLTIDRRDLTDPGEIVERMARDILGQRREGQHGSIDLTECGWTVAQAMRFGSRAHEAALAPPVVCQDAAEQLAAAERDPVAAVDVAAVVAAGEAAVAAAVLPATGDRATMLDDLGGAA